MILQISAGINPPIECRIFVSRFTEYLKSIDPDLQVLDIGRVKDNTPFAHPRSMLIYSDLDLSEYIGTLQWIWKSKVRPGHKRKNWFIDVSEIEPLSEDELNSTLDESLCKWSAFKSSGPGGQHVNKTSSGVRLEYGNYTVTSTSERSQLQNKNLCKKKLIAILKNQGLIEIANQKNFAWKKHNAIVRGNPVKVFKEDELGE